MFVTHFPTRTFRKLMKKVFTKSAVILSSVDRQYSGPC